MSTNQTDRDDLADMSRRAGNDDDPARAAIADVQSAVQEPDRPLGLGDVEAVGVGGLSGDGGHPLGPLTGAAAIDPNDPGRVTAEGPLGSQVSDEEARERRRES